VTEPAIDIYAAAFVAPGRHELGSGPVVRTAPGLRGVAVVRLLVTDDSGYDELVAEAGLARWGVVMAFEQAVRCHEFLRDRPEWSATGTELAMVLGDIDAATDAQLPDGLELRPVNRPEEPGSVSLEDAAATAVASDPGIPDPPDKVAGFLGGLPSSVRLFAAVDAEGAVRATAACHVFGEYAQVFFVTTEPAWRRRGIGSAMTLGALRAAASLGARQAFLHSTEDGVSVYTGLGFEPVGLVTRYACAD
jgi:ribosomal protein S18 acetylase RimI-like enzyme